MKPIYAKANLLSNKGNRVGQVLDPLDYLDHLLYSLPNKYNFQQTPPAATRGGKQVRKGVRWMPRLLQAKKDVISCEKPRGGANDV